ncbi:hypothetical protein BC629DRAFT_1259638, partial [Irpex lacteus]
LMRISHRRGYIDRESYVAQYLALALFTIGVASSLGTDDLLATFAAGVYLLSHSPTSRHLPPLNTRYSISSSHRTMLVLYHWIPEISGWREGLFSAHFGTSSRRAVFVTTLALSRLPEPHSPPQNQQEYLAATLQTIVAFIVLGSILIRTSR